LPVFHDWSDWPCFSALVTRPYASGRFFRATAVSMKRRATFCAPGFSFTVAGTFDTSTAGWLVSGVAWLLPVFDQMIPAAIAPPTRTTATTHGSAFCQPGLRWISGWKIESTSALTVTSE
jgi:hypothetical protein